MMNNEIYLIVQAPSKAVEEGPSHWSRLKSWIPISQHHLQLAHPYAPPGEPDQDDGQTKRKWTLLEHKSNGYYAQVSIQATRILRHSKGYDEEGAFEWNDFQQRLTRYLWKHFKESEVNTITRTWATRSAHDPTTSFAGNPAQ